MAKPLVLVYQGASVHFELEKVERSKLYGYVDTEVVDEAGKRCELGALIADGRSVVGKGGTALAYLSPDGQWLKKSDLKPVDVHGKVITPVKSTFDAPVPLDKPATIGEYLSHNINLIYQLKSEAEPAGLRDELESGTIYQFPFSWRGGLEASAGFLLMGGDGNLFLCVGLATTLKFIGLQAAAPAAPADAGEAVADEEDALDFSLA